MLKPHLKYLAVVYLLFFMYRAYFWNGYLSSVLISFSDIAVSYITALLLYFILEKKLRIKKIYVFLLQILCFPVAALALKWVHYWGYVIAGDMTPRFVRVFATTGFQVFDVLAVLLVGVAAMYAGFKHIESERNRLISENLLHEKHEAELRFLKSQINPHFIFNSLNTVYFAIDKQNQDARDILGTFSSLLRYMLYHCDKERVHLHDEIDFIKQYLDIYRYRMGDRMDIRISIDHTENNIMLPPLLLVPFVENAIKHAGNGNEKKSVIDISMNREDIYLNFTVCNTVNATPGEPGNSGGIGIANIRRRLELLYDRSFKLDISQKDQLFSVQLSIPV